jgi:hypothetical protein
LLLSMFQKKSVTVANNQSQKRDAAREALR